MCVFKGNEEVSYIAFFTSLPLTVLHNLFRLQKPQPLSRGLVGHAWPLDEVLGSSPGMGGFVLVQ